MTAALWVLAVPVALIAYGMFGALFQVAIGRRMGLLPRDVVAVWPVWLLVVVVHAGAALVYRVIGRREGDDGRRCRTRADASPPPLPPFQTGHVGVKPPTASPNPPRIPRPTPRSDS